MTFTPARGETSIINKDFDPPKIASREEKQAAQKLLANNNNSPISLSAIGIGLLSLVTMLVVRLRRGLQPATILASSGGLGFDMPRNASPQKATRRDAFRAGAGLAAALARPCTAWA